MVFVRLGLEVDLTTGHITQFCSFGMLKGTCIPLGSLMGAIVPSMMPSSFILYNLIILSAIDDPSYPVLLHNMIPNRSISIFTSSGFFSPLNDSKNFSSAFCEFIKLSVN
jgi:hypothetical protein